MIITRLIDHNLQNNADVHNSIKNATIPIRKIESQYFNGTAKFKSGSIESLHVTKNYLTERSCSLDNKNSS